LYKPNFITLSC